MSAARDITGLRFGKLTVVERSINRNGASRWVCRCDCGNQKAIYGQHIISGRTRSCGCKRQQNFVANLKAGTARWNARRTRAKSALLDTGPDLSPLLRAAGAYWGAWEGVSA